MEEELKQLRSQVKQEFHEDEMMTELHRVRILQSLNEGRITKVQVFLCQNSQYIPV